MRVLDKYNYQLSKGKMNLLNTINHPAKRKKNT